MTTIQTKTSVAAGKLYKELRERDQTLIFLGLGGSHAYGTNHENSDIDYRGVFMPNTKDLLGLSSGKAVENIQRSEPDDLVIYELGKFMKLALDNNPNILELLYTPIASFIDPLFQRILDYRSFILSQRAKKKYAGYAIQQMGRFERAVKGLGNDDGRFKPEHRSKHLMHCFRLVDQCTRMLETGELDIVVRNLEELQELAEKSYDDYEYFKGEFTKRLAKMDAVRSVLPEHPDEAFFNGLLIRLRLEHLNG